MRIREIFSVKISSHHPVLLECDSQSQIGEEKQQSDESPTESPIGANVQEQQQMVEAGRKRGVEETVRIGNAEEDFMEFDANYWQK